MSACCCGCLIGNQPAGISSGSTAALCNGCSSICENVANNVSGNVAYNANSPSAVCTGGVVNSSAPATKQAPSACGGNGSFLAALQDVFTQGLDDNVVSATCFAMGSFNNLLANSTGYAEASSAAQPAPAAQSATSPTTVLLVIGGVALAAYLLLRKV